MGLCDFHCHLLPQIDDGYITSEGYARMLRLYKESGVSSIAFTPHIYNPYMSTDVGAIRETFKWASKIALDMGMVTYLGSELFVGDQAELKSIPIAGKYSLVEFGLSLPPANLIPRLEKLRDEGLTIIIAHVERYRWLSPSSPALKRLLALGALLQVNVEAVEDGSALPYLKSGLVDLIATDSHGDETLPSRMLAALNDWPAVLKKMEGMIV
ncbi:MAG: capsule biosynthesis protein CapC [Sphaerochaeta sp.]|nr:capsule biosynthesis protein CapC [Sphaerochaeta sp.]